MKSLKTVTEVLGLDDGYRLITNVGKLVVRNPSFTFSILVGKIDKLTYLD